MIQMISTGGLAACAVTDAHASGAPASGGSYTKVTSGRPPSPGPPPAAVPALTRTTRSTRAGRLCLGAGCRLTPRPGEVAGRQPPSELALRGRNNWWLLHFLREDGRGWYPGLSIWADLGFGGRSDPARHRGATLALAQAGAAARSLTAARYIDLAAGDGAAPSSWHRGARDVGGR